MMARVLKITRIIVSLIVMSLLGAATVSILWQIPWLSAWLQRIQLGQAIAVMSLPVFASWMLVTLLFGRVYCSSVCPLGTLMDLSAALRRRTQKPLIPYRYSPPLTAWRIAIFSLYVLAVATMVVQIVALLNPYGDFAIMCKSFISPLIERQMIVSVSTTIVALVLFVVVAGVAWNRGRLICNTVCPIGTMLGGVSRASIFQFDIDTDKCTQCRRCEYVCKAQCINLNDHKVDGSRCVVCFDCINACGDDAIHYTTNRKRLSAPLMQRIPDPLAPEPQPEPEAD